MNFLSNWLYQGLNIGLKNFAETHYKFQLPFSGLYKKHPEIIVDAPHWISHHQKIPIFIIVKDADYFPINVLNIHIHGKLNRKVSNSGNPDILRSQTLEWKCEKNLQWKKIEIENPGYKDELVLNVSLKYELKNGKEYSLLNHNLPGLSGIPLKIHFAPEGWPQPANWINGETHCHTHWSSDPVEFGAPPALLQDCGTYNGMDYCCTTDHSYDFQYAKERFMQEVNPDDNFELLKTEIDKCNRVSDSVLIGNSLNKVPHRKTFLLAGEEVSCGNSHGKNVHLLVYGNKKFIPGWGDGGRRWFNNKPDLSIEESLAMLDDGVAIAAHPQSRPGLLESLIFRRGYWENQDFKFSSDSPTASKKEIHSSKLAKQIIGTQFWNGNHALSFMRGKAQWVQMLLKGQQILPIGGTDAHGDLNRSTSVKIPLWKLQENRNHVFGQIRTLLPGESSSLSPSALLNAFRSGKTCISNGPFVSLNQGDGSSSNVSIMCLSKPGFGYLKKIRLFAGKMGASQEKLILDKKGDGNSYLYHLEEAIPHPYHYLRAEVFTTLGYRGISSALILS